METNDAIGGRRSVRSFLDKPVPEDVIQRILKAGAMAPSAMDRQPARYIVIDDRSRIKELSDKVKQSAGMLGLGLRVAEMMKVKADVIFYDAPLLILVVAEKGDFIPVDCALAAQNMMLRAYDLGLGSCFIGFGNFLKNDRATLRAIGVQDNQDIVCPLIFGYPKDWPKKKEREPKVQNRIKG